MRKVLVFAPHPDDDVIGCGGSIINHVIKGNSVGVAYVTSGDIGSLTYTSADIMAIREAEAAKAARFLGVTQLHFLRKPDGFLQYSRETVMAITSLLRSFRPDVVYIPHQQDEHRDHRMTHDLVLECCAWAASPRAGECGCELWAVGTILCYEVGTPLPAVHYVEDISAVMDRKIEAMQMHESQVAVLPYDEAVKSMNRLRGITTNRGQYCECFQVVKVAELF
ncbi:MAG: PIG-L family deacetylase [Negativicutes bacterium]|nr:PIG-L family deacetylase [Negativicutes bacterium]